MGFRAHTPARSLAVRPVWLPWLLFIGVVVCLFVSSALSAADTPEEPADLKHLIERMFPKSTVIGDKETGVSVPTWPVYQLNQIIGYAYESGDLVDFPGFSGETMNFLVGIDTAGNIRGVEVLYHHEPIFMHGLGPKPFTDFLDQYAGHGISEQIVVGKARGAGGNDVTYFDGVTKATVSVNIANDAVLVSAMKLARDRIDAFAQGAPAEVRDDIYEPLTFNELRDAGYVKTWQLDRFTVGMAWARISMILPTTICISMKAIR